MFPALLCGNSVVIKPSEDVPHTVHLLVEILLEAGLPPEVVQLVHGRGETVGKALVEHRGVPVISFTGSTETGAIIGETCGRMHKRSGSGLSIAMRLRELRQRPRGELLVVRRGGVRGDGRQHVSYASSSSAPRRRCGCWRWSPGPD